ncbi:MAG: phosphate ABC transporter permease PstA [Myxococcota bacterium]
MNTLRERVGFGVLGAAAISVVLAGLALFVFLFFEGGEVLSLDFVFDIPREGMTEGGVLPAIVGTALVTLVTGVCSIPLGVGAALYLHEYAPVGFTTRLIRLSIRNLSGVPSIVYGLFGVALFVHGMGIGLSVLASGLTLGLLTLPWTITASEEALRTVPAHQRAGALALGATKWEAIRTVVLPAATPGIITGAILGLARAAGETAPILFTGVTFFQPETPTSLFDQFMALPYHLYILATQHHDIERVRPIAYGTALLLLLLVALFTSAAALLRIRLRQSA